MIVENLNLDNNSDLIGKDMYYINDEYLNSSIDLKVIEDVFNKPDFYINIPIIDLNGEKQYKIKVKSFKVGNDSYCIISFIDKTKELIYNQKIFELVFTDELTKLSNRRKVLKDLDELVNTADPKNDKFAMLFIDIDKFKDINDTYGHDIGDITLKIVASRLKNSVDSKDCVSRIGGDEFMIILKDMQRKGQINVIADRIIENVKKGFIVNKIPLKVTVSIGISIFPEDGHTRSNLMKNADKALYKVKNDIRGCYKYNC